MSILVDTVEDQVVDLNQGVESDPKPQEEAPAQDQAAEPELPEKFQGKSLADVIEMYTNLESEYGRQGNQLGEYRTMTDRFLTIEEKRLDDLQKSGAPQPEEIKIDPTEFLSDPTRVMNEYYEQRKSQDTAYQALENRLNQLEGQLGQVQVAQTYEDVDQITADPQFHAWVKASPHRQGIAVNAIQNRDANSLSFLLSEWKERQALLNQGQPAQEQDPLQTQQQQEIQAAQQVSTETGSTGNATSSNKPRFSRAKLVQLKINNPDEYERMNDQIVLAYHEGRVDD